MWAFFFSMFIVFFVTLYFLFLSLVWFIFIVLLTQRYFSMHCMMLWCSKTVQQNYYIIIRNHWKPPSYFTFDSEMFYFFVYCIHNAIWHIAHFAKQTRCSVLIKLPRAFVKKWANRNWTHAKTFFGAVEAIFQQKSDFLLTKICLIVSDRFLTYAGTTWHNWSLAPALQYMSYFRFTHDSREPA